MRRRPSGFDRPRAGSFARPGRGRDRARAQHGPPRRTGSVSASRPGSDVQPTGRRGSEGDEHGDRPMRPGGMPTHEGDLSIEGTGSNRSRRPPATARSTACSRSGSRRTSSRRPSSSGCWRAADFLQVGFATGLLAIVVGNLIGSVPCRAPGQMGPRPAWPRCRCRARLRQVDRRAGLLNWISCIGWDGINSVFGAAALSILTGLAVRRLPW